MLQSSRPVSYSVLSDRTGAIALTVREAGPAGPPKPRLFDRVREAIRTRHYSRRTEKAYGVPRLMALLLYGAGLRLLECAGLRVKDIDLARHLESVRRQHHASGPGNGLSGNTQTVALRAGIAKRVSCHTFRHSFATHLP